MAQVKRFTLSGAFAAGTDVFVAGAGFFRGGVLDVAAGDTTALAAVRTAAPGAVETGPLDDVASPAPAGPSRDPYPEYLKQDEGDARYALKGQGGAGEAVSDATASVKGVVQLAGDLGGTASAPTVPGLAAKVNTSTYTSGLAGKANAAHTHPLTDIVASGTRDATTYLRGDNTWATPAGGGSTTTDASLLASGILPADRIGDASIADAKLASGTALTPSERTKLTGIATGATANSADATLLARANHTGTQAATTITGLSTVATSGAYNDLSGKPAAGTALGYVDATLAPYNADKTGATDATAAIQAAIDQVVANGGGTVFLPRGTYLLSGVQRTGTVTQAKNYTYSGQILFPARNMTQGYMTVRIMGETPADNVFWGPQTGDAVPVEVGGTILKTTATAGNVIDCVPPTNIGALASDPDMPGFTNMTVSIENVIVRAPNNPQCGGINLSRAIGASIRNTTVGVDATTASVAQPTGTGVGIRLPLSYNGAHVEVDGSQVYGYPVGLTHAEHARLRGFSVYACAIGIRPDIAYHLSSYERVLLQRNIRHLVAGNGDPGNPILIEGTIAFESGSTGWYATTYDVDDVNNAFRGALQFTRWNDPTVVVRGASNLRLTNLRTALPQVTSSNLTKIERITQAAYDALGTKDTATLYAIVG